MRIVLAPTEIAGQIGMLCYGLRKLGLQVGGYNWFHSYIGYKKHIINTDAYELAKLLDPLIHFCDIFHFHNGNTILADHSDVPMIKRSGKKMVMQHWGNDVRTEKRGALLNPYRLPPGYFSDRKIHKRLTFFSEYIKTAIVQDYEVYPHVQDYYRHVHVLPLACDVSSIEAAYPNVGTVEPIIIHAPTDRDFKGSVYIEHALTMLSEHKFKFTYQPVEKMSHEAAMQAYRSADIIIDQVLCGSYGMLSVEAMAMGKVVVAFIRDDVLAKLPSDLPIVNARPETLYATLEHLIRHPELRRELGIAGRQYVEKYHDVIPVARKLIAIYEQL